jgi:colanic acid/amylovoran biosynthesis glycosyltransferase
MLTSELQVDTNSMLSSGNESSSRMRLDDPVALIFRARLLAFSETFIRSQADAMKTFRPFFVGIKKVNGWELPDDSSWVANRGGFRGITRELRFRLLGPSMECKARLRELKPKILHAHFGPDACEAIPLGLDLGVPLIATFHGYDATLTDSGFRRSRHGRRYLRRRSQLRGNVTLFLAVSEFIRKQIEEQGFPSDRIRVHHIGVDVEQFRHIETGARERQVLFVGRLVEKKGCSYLIKAMAQVQAMLPDTELVIIGDGTERKTLENEARHLLRKYKFLGAQSSSVVKQWMQKVSLFCVPSITASNGDAEGFGIVFAEAQASGLPVVSFSSGGIPEAVAHGETGFLAPEGQWRKLAEYILLLLQNQGLRKQFSHAGRRRVEEKFDLHKQTASLEAIYQEVLTSYSANNKRLQ